MGHLILGYCVGGPICVYGDGMQLNADNLEGYRRAT